MGLKTRHVGLQSGVSTQLFSLQTSSDQAPLVLDHYIFLCFLPRHVRLVGKIVFLCRYICEFTRAHSKSPRTVSKVRQLELLWFFGLLRLTAQVCRKIGATVVCPGQSLVRVRFISAALTPRFQRFCSSTHKYLFRVTTISCRRSRVHLVCGQPSANR